MKILDVSEIISPEQREWTKKLRTDSIIINHWEIRGTKDTGADLFSIRKDLLLKVSYDGLVRVDPYE